MTSIESIFPLKGVITKEILANSSPWNPLHCPGALTLIQALGDFANGRQIGWGIWTGVIDGVYITTEEELAIPFITKPTTVTFIIKK